MLRALALGLPGLAALLPTPSASAQEESLPQWNCSARVELSQLWAHLSGKYDIDGDGRISPAEYDRGASRFRNYDRNGDGLLSDEDFPPDTHFNGFNAMIVRGADGNGDREVTRAEWDGFAERLDADGDGDATKGEVVAAMGGGMASDWPLFLLSFDQDGDGKFTAFDIEVTFTDADANGDGTLSGAETRGWLPTSERPETPPPAVGARAPDFDLPFMGGDTERFQLSEHIAATGKPVALVFGSYT